MGYYLFDLIVCLICISKLISDNDLLIIGLKKLWFCWFCNVYNVM